MTVEDRMRVPLTILHDRLGPGWHTFVTRDGTDDEAVIEEIMVEDVYQLRGLDLAPQLVDIGDWENAERVGQTVIDCGAHIGVFAATALKMGAAKVVVVEPQPDNYALLCRNLEVFGEKTVEYWNAAIGPAQGETTIGGHGAQARTGVDPERGLRVEQVTLTHLLTPHEQVAVLKIDVEGAEYAALLATPPAMLARCDRIVMEWHGPEECRWVERSRIGEVVQHLLGTHSPTVFGKPERGGYLFAHANDR